MSRKQRSQRQRRGRASIRRSQAAGGGLGFEFLEDRRLLAVVNFDPGAYPSQYNPGGTGYLTGTTAVDLSPGTHDVRFGGSALFTFEVDGVGNVTSNNIAAATGAGNTLTFNNTAITIDPAAYSTVYRPDRIAPFGQTGVQSLTVVPNINNYQIAFINSPGFTFNVDASGNITSNNTAAAQGIGNTLQFNTTTITVDPGAFTGVYRPKDIAPFGQVGVQNLTVLPNIDNYLITIAGSDGLSFDVDAAGNVNSDNAIAATGVGSTLTFNTTPITFDPVSYAGAYNLEGTTGNVSGVQSVDVVLNQQDYRLEIGSSERFGFDVDAAGNVISLNPGVVAGSGNTLTFNNTSINIDPGAYTGNIDLERITGNVSGPQAITVVPNVNNYLLQIADTGALRIDVDASGNVSTTNSAAANAAGNTLMLNNKTLTIDPDTYSGNYDVRRVSGIVSGIQSFVFVPGIDNYNLRVASIPHLFDLDGGGQPTPSIIPVTVGPDTFNFVLSMGCSLSVTTTSDGGPGSLRDAIICANATPGADTINIPAGTYALSLTGSGEDAAATGDLDITDDLTIVGAGAASTIIDATGLGDRAFHILSGVVEISGVSIQGGDAGVNGEDGGGALNLGILGVTDSVITGNTGTFGGGLFNQGTLNVVASTVSGNTSEFEGGGIFNDGMVTVGDSAVNANYTNSGGGAGVYNTGTLNVANSTISGNYNASGFSGAGFYNAGGGTLTVTGSTINDNYTDTGDGGGFLNGGTLELTDSTLSGNIAETGWGAGVANLGTATITGSTVSVGYAYFGAGVANFDAMTIANSTVSGNTGQEAGGGIYNSGTLEVDNSTISGNSGQGVANYFGGDLSVTNSTISGNNYDNSNAVYGGGFLNNDATLSVAGSTISENSAYYGGGGIFNYAGAVSVTNSTVSGNSSIRQGGGGLYNLDTLSVVNSTISGNTASAYPGGGFQNYGTLSVTNSTVTDNSAAYGGGLNSGGTSYLNNTIVARNNDSFGTPDIVGVLSGNNNLIGDGTGGTVAGSGNQVGISGSPIDPILGPLQNNGGSTETHELLTGSPAIDAGDNSLANDHGPDATIGGGDDTPLTTDQRGTGSDRVGDGTVDIGAFEVQGLQCGSFVWTEQDKVTASDGAALDVFGRELSLSGDTLVVGSVFQDAVGPGSDSGAAYVYRYNGTSWTEQAKLVSNDLAAVDRFGKSVAIDGDTIVVGAQDDDDLGPSSGSAYVFQRTGTTWTQQAKLTALDGDNGDSFGNAVAIHDDTIVVSATSDEHDGSLTGTAYVFQRTGATWNQQAKLVPSDGAVGDFFGISLSIDGDTIVAGAARHASASGAAYVFERSGTTWSEQAKLTATDGAANDLFGDAVSLDGDTVAIGAYANDDDGTNSGSAYVFQRSGTSWSQEAKLTASDAATGDLFGFSASLSGDTLVLGAFDDDDSGSASGSAYVFEWSGTSWTEDTKLLANDGGAGDFFGWSVAIDNNTIAVGAPQDDDVASQAGAAYLFDLTCVTNTDPVAEDDSETTPEDTPVTVDVLNNDSDVDGNLDPTTVSVVSGPSNGGTVVNPTTGEVTYTPAPDFHGTDMFTYEVCDTEGLCATATVTITVTPVNDPPTANDDSDTVAEDSGATNLAVLANDSILPDSGETLTITAAGPGSAGGTITIVGGSSIDYTPAANFFGTETFDYTINDGTAGSDATATVTITVTPVNDPPTANDDSDTVAEDSGATNLAVLANDSILPDSGETLTITAAGPGSAGGTITIVGGSSIDYTPAANFFGTETFGYTINDGTAGSDATATVTITVTPVNDPPTANDDSDTVAEDSGATNLAVLANDSILPDSGETLTITAAGPGSAGGTITIVGGSSIDYTPAANFFGTETFSYTINDGTPGSDDTATVTVTVTPVNDDPTVVADVDPVTVNEGVLATNSGSFNDVDTADNVTITASVGAITFQDAGNTGNWSWEFDSSDGPLESQLVTITADDNNGGVTETTFQLNVVNLAPTITSISVPLDPVDINDQASFNVDVDFTDPAGAVDEPFTCDFDMDGDLGTDITVSGVTGTSCSTPLNYSEPGVYTVTATVTDKDGDTSDPVTATQFIVIYDPSGGFVTGGGWINSPPGACTFEDCTVDTVGKANFGFVSKYKKGASVPTGQTEFQFKAGDLNFHSSSYDWLVIAGKKAMYKGDGTVNGDPGFTFQINAIDGDLSGGDGIDKFRIKIKETGGGVIYDNQMGAGDNDDPTTALGGGNIKIHKAKPSAAAAAVPGDANLDGLVDFEDFVILASNFGRSDAFYGNGDFDGDGSVQFSDFLILSSRFQRTPLDVSPRQDDPNLVDSVFEEEGEEEDWWLDVELDVA